jgi:hypothetical protein
MVFFGFTLVLSCTLHVKVAWGIGAYDQLRPQGEKESVFEFADLIKRVWFEFKAEQTSRSEAKHCL